VLHKLLFPEGVMDRSKLTTCLIAAVITLAGATHLAKPVQATEALEPCTATQSAYADGFAAGSCGGRGTVGGCEQTGGGGFTFWWTCENEH
jgi:hypothetical protein